MLALDVRTESWDAWERWCARQGLCLGESERERESVVEGGDLRSSSGVRSVVIDSVMVSVTPVVSAEGFAGSETVTGDRGGVEQGDAAAASRRKNEYSTMCVYRVT